MGEIVYKKPDDRTLLEQEIEEAIESNTYITIEYYKDETGFITFVPILEDATDSVYEVSHFSVHMSLKLGLTYKYIRE